jgi:hypothetical protein
MSVGAKYSPPQTGFVNWTGVPVLFLAVQQLFSAGLEEDRRRLVVKHFGLLFVQTAPFTVPSTALQIQTECVTTVFRLRIHIIFTRVHIYHQEIESQCVDWKFVLLLRKIYFS